MDAKLNHSDFNALLSKHLNITVSKAENFTRAFFDILIEGLENDGIVKINGLGTFKMIDVASRGSVNVNTGEKIEIKGHRKLTFIPADTLKDKINQPFAMFEPVEVDDDYIDDDDSDTVEPAIDEQPLESQAAEPAIDEQPLESQAAEPAIDEQPLESQAAEPAIDEQPLEPQAAEPAIDEQPLEPQAAEPAIDEQPLESQAAEPVKSNRGYIYTALSTLFIIIVAVVMFFVFSNNDKQEDSKGAKTAHVEENAAEVVQIPDTVVNQPEEVEKFVIVEAMGNLSLAQITIKDTTIYSIKGTMAVHRVGLDETLTKISLQYFEDKRFWPYIVQYNRIKNYNSLEIGTELLIPHLVPRIGN